MWKASRASPAVTCASSSSVKVISRMGLPEYNTARKRQVVERFRESFPHLPPVLYDLLSRIVPNSVLLADEFSGRSKRPKCFDSP